MSSWSKDELRRIAESHRSMRNGSVPPTRRRRPALRSRRNCLRSPTPCSPNWSRPMSTSSECQCITLVCLPCSHPLRDWRISMKYAIIAHSKRCQPNPFGAACDESDLIFKLVGHCFSVDLLGRPAMRLCSSLYCPVSGWMLMRPIGRISFHSSYNFIAEDLELHDTA